MQCFAQIKTAYAESAAVKNNIEGQVHICV